MKNSDLNIEQIFDEIPDRFPNFHFEKRNEQIEMVREVQSAFKKSKHLVLEAGTGVGKSLAYLLPAISFAYENDTTVLISTETIALQNQLINKDIPFVSQLLNIQDLRAEIALGSGNYVCKRKLGNLISSGNFDPDMIPHLKEFYEWEKKTKAGIKSEYKGYATYPFWQSVTRDPDNCLGRNCPNFSKSYYFLEKEKWKQAHILIVNHYLLAAHLASTQGLLPEFKHVVIDEAHSFADILGRSLRISMDHQGIQDLLNFLSGNDKRNNGLIHRLKKIKTTDSILTLIDSAKRESTNFYQRVLTANPMIYQTKRILKNHGLDTGSLPEIYESLSDELESWKEFYREDSTDPEEKEISVELDYLFKKLKSFSEFLELFRQGSDDEFVVWMDPSSVSDKNIYYDLHIQPLNSSDLLRERFFSELSTLVFTSATLTTGKNKFEYFFHQIGSSSFDTGNFPSPFPYSKNCLIYLPRNISDPAEKPDDFVEELQLLIPKLLELTEGNSFLLFTSNKLLNEVYKLISEIVDYPCISQLEWGAEKAKQMYLETDHAVLFGVSTFWQGIDIRGDKLKSVLIIKLPFQPPGEPVLETKIENLKKKNGNPFMEIQLPHSILTLKQGFGRLIRSGTDKGFVAILDPRIQTKRYGGDLLKSLPPAKLVYSYKELRENYKELLGG